MRLFDSERIGRTGLQVPDLLLFALLMVLARVTGQVAGNLIWGGCSVWDGVDTARDQVELAARLVAFPLVGWP